jgi:VWFA-related protein
MSNHRFWPRTLVALLLAALAVGARGDELLTTADVVRFLKAGISESTILAELSHRGFGEPLDEAHEAALREAGASETLIVAVRRTAPLAAVAPSPAAPAASGTTHREAPPPRTQGPKGLTFGVAARSVRVPVSVLDKRGEPVLGLHEADFEVTEDGRRQEVTYFSGERRPLRIALALDTSASMTSKMREVADALERFINLLEPQDEIMVISFANEVRVEQDFTSDRDLLEHVFSRLQAEGGTALYDATLEAVRRVAKEPAESKAVVLVTDGMDTTSRSSFVDLLETARRSEVPVFSIALGGDSGLGGLFRTLGSPGGGMGFPGGRGPRGPGRGGWPPGGGGGGGRGGWPGGSGRAPGGSPSEFDARPLLDLADETGGRAEILKGLEHDALRSGRIKQAAESIAMTLRHRYLVGYEPAGTKQGWRKIKVDVERPSVKVQARKGYYAES